MLGLEEVAEEVRRRHHRAYAQRTGSTRLALESGGHIQWRVEGEEHGPPDPVDQGPVRPIGQRLEERPQHAIQLIPVREHRQRHRLHLARGPESPAPPGPPSWPRTPPAPPPAGSGA